MCLNRLLKCASDCHGVWLTKWNSSCSRVSACKQWSVWSELGNECGARSRIRAVCLCVIKYYDLRLVSNSIHTGQDMGKEPQLRQFKPGGVTEAKDWHGIDCEFYGMCVLAVSQVQLCVSSQIRLIFLASPHPQLHLPCWTPKSHFYSLCSESSLFGTSSRYMFELGQGQGQGEQNLSAWASSCGKHCTYCTVQCSEGMCLGAQKQQGAEVCWSK